MGHTECSTHHWGLFPTWNIQTGQHTPLGAVSLTLEAVVTTWEIWTGQDAPLGTVSRTTGPRKDHCASIMLGGEGPGEVGLPSTIASANRENSCTHASEAQALQLVCTPLERNRPRSPGARRHAELPRSLDIETQCPAICSFCAREIQVSLGMCLHLCNVQN